MRFHEHPLTHQETIRGRGLAALPRGEQLRGVTMMLAEHDLNSATNIGIQMESEVEWLESGSPYYDVWPTVTEPFLRVRLSNVRCCDVRLPRSPLLLRFAVGHEPLGKIKTIMASQTQLPKSSYQVLPALANASPVKEVLHVAINDGDVEHYSYRMHAHTIANIVSSSDAMLEDALDIKPEQQFSPHVIDHEMITAAYRLVLAVSLIGDDPEIIEPLCLTSDAARYDGTEDEELQRRLIDRARRRGKHGYAVGKRMQVTPGVVQPHFGIRWMGHRPNLVARLRPIDGWIIKKRVIASVPTGYMGERHDDAHG